jgi:hypothetical protein
MEPAFQNSPKIELTRIEQVRKGGLPPLTAKSFMV